MQLHANLSNDLKAVARSAKRLRGQSVYADTKRYWADQLFRGRAATESSRGGEADQLKQLVCQVEQELRAHSIPI